jgi:hypothetical protein
MKRDTAAGLGLLGEGGGGRLYEAFGGGSEEEKSRRPKGQGPTTRPSVTTAKVTNYFATLHRKVAPPHSAQVPLCTGVLLIIRLYSLVSTSMVPIMDLSIDSRAHVDDPSRRHSLRLDGYYVYPACPPRVDSLFHYGEESHRSPLRRGIPAGSLIHQDECWPGGRQSRPAAESAERVDSVGATTSAR